MTTDTDLERSTFQDKPAYRYIRASDNLPTPDEISEQRDTETICKVKLFNPAGAGTWYIAAYEPATRQAFGAAIITDFEYGYFHMGGLVEFRGWMGLPLERDLHWTPRPLSECEGT